MVDYDLAAITRRAFAYRMIEFVEVDSWQILPGMTVVDAEVAARKSWALLLDWLTPEQRTEFLNFGTFRVKGGDSGRTYIIQNVVNYSTSYKGQSFCFQPAGAMPHADKLLGMKLALEHNEAEALRVANRRGTAQTLDNPPERRSIFNW